MILQLVTNYDVVGGAKMKLFLLTVCFLCIFLAGQIADAAPVSVLVQEFDIVADKAVTPLDYSFFDEAGQGKLEFYDLKNLYGAGAKLFVYVTTDTGNDWLIFSFGGGMIESRLMNRQLSILTERFSAITKTTPMTLTILDGQLTVKIGQKSRTVKNVYGFTGTLTTQSISGKGKFYRFVEQ